MKFDRVGNTLTDPIVQDAIRGIGKLEGSVGYALTGGMAVQCYINPQFYRATTDADIVLYRPANGLNTFQQLFAPALEELARLAYAIRIDKERSQFSIQMVKEDERFNISAPRRTPAYYGARSAFLEAERSRLRRMPQAQNALVTSPEDLIVHKLARIAAKERAESLSPIPREASLSALHAYLQDERSRFVGDFDKAAQDYARMSTLRMQSDIHDVVALLETAKVDSGLLRENIFAQPVFSGEYGERALNAVSLVHPRVKEVTQPKTSVPVSPSKFTLEDATNPAPGSVSSSAQN